MIDRFTNFDVVLDWFTNFDVPMVIEVGDPYTFISLGHNRCVAYLLNVPKLRREIYKVLDLSQKPLLMFPFPFCVKQVRCGLSSIISTSVLYFSRAGPAFDLPSYFSILWRVPCNDDPHRAKPAVVSLQPDCCCWYNGFCRVISFILESKPQGVSHLID